MLIRQQHKCIMSIVQSYEFFRKQKVPGERRAPVGATLGVSHCDLQGWQRVLCGDTCNISCQPCINNKPHNATCEHRASTTRAFNRCDARLRISILFDKERVFTTDLRLKASPDHSFMGLLLRMHYIHRTS